MSFLHKAMKKVGVVTLDEIKKYDDPQFFEQKIPTKILVRTIIEKIVTSKYHVSKFEHYFNSSNQSYEIFI